MSGLRHGDWHLISEQKFRRRAGLQVVAQHFRGAPYIVVCDQLTGQYLRLSGRAQLLWDRLDGQRSMHELWREMARLPGGVAPGQKELMDWVLQLASTGLILSDHEIDPGYLSRRSQAKRDTMLEAKAISPLAVRIPLFDPQWLVRLCYPLVRPLFSRSGALVLALLLLAGLVAGMLNAASLLGSSAGLFLSQSGLLAMLLAYPLLKALHELGHALVLCHYGHQVREAGVMLLLFLPVPYVDASATVAIPSPKARMLVSAAGMIVELAVAALALLLWQQAESGLLQALLYSFILTGTISTLAFNGNPLLKFDAYYVLSDWLEIPNLAQRSGAVLQDRFLAFVLGLRPQEAALPHERRIFLTYGVLSLIYRLFLTFVIVATVAQFFYVVGLILAFWSLATSVIWPVVKMIRKGREMAQAENARRRVGARVAVILGAVLAVAAFLPLPFSAVGEGRIVPRPQSEIRAGTSGFVTEQTLLPEGSLLAAGALVLQLEDSAQVERLAALRLARQDLDTRLAAPGLGAPQRRVLLAQQQSLLESLTQLEDLAVQSRITAPQAGRVLWQGGSPPAVGSHLQRGDMPGHIQAPGLTEGIVALPAHYAGVIPADGAGAALLLPDGTGLTGQVLSRRLISPGDPVPAALLARNGGPLAESAAGDQTALGAALALWIGLSPQQDLRPGQSVSLRISLEPRPLLGQLLFHIERIFLRVTRL